jgi:glycosyltransferase involved in cell wall biosynthesis
MGKKKIAFITSSPRTVLAFLQNHIKCLSLQFDVYIISNIKGTNEKENLTILIDENARKSMDEFATFIHIGITRRISIINDINAIISLFRIFKEEKFSSVHSITSKVGIMVMISAFIAGIKHRFHTYTGQVWVNMNGLKYFFFKFMDKLIGILCTNCYADSASQMDFLIKKKVVRKNKISVLGEGSISGVDIKRFLPDVKMRNKVRESLSIPKDEIVFLLLCRLTKDKGVLDIAKAFSNLVIEINCTLLIVGPDEENLINDIKSIVGNYSISKLVFIGFTECHENFLNASDILCLPSYREGFGTVIIDAAAAGIPAIGSDIYGIRDAIVDGETGILHKPGDVIEIYNAMYKLSTNVFLRQKMGQAAFQRVKKKFTMQKITAAWLNEYNEIIQSDN